MPINGSGGNGFPAAIMAVIEQKNYLQTLFRKTLFPTRVFRPRVVKPDDYFQGRIGETKTFTASGLIAPSTATLNPATNTGLDNGMVADARTFEQWTATLNEWASFIPTNIYGQEALIADIYLDNAKKEVQKAGDSLELVCVQRLLNAYDSGDTFILTAATTPETSLHVDNIKGFDTQYPQANLPLYQSPVPTSATNPVYAALISGSTGLISSLGYVTGATPDVSNISYMQNGGQQFGVSGVLTVDTNLGGASAAIGDRLVALDPGAAAAANPPAVGKSLNPVFKDGSYVVRPTNAGGNMITTGYAMAATNPMNPSVMIPYAVSILKRRAAKPLANGLYGCAIDSTLLASFYSDQGFQRATMGDWDRGRVFANGIIAKGWGVEFVDHTQVPPYSSPAGGEFTLRHALVFGDDAIAEHPFIGARDASDIVAEVGDVADERWAERIRFRSLAALDDLGQVIKFAYDYIGDFQPRTDKTSNPTIVQTSDYSRYKRAILLQASSAY